MALVRFGALVQAASGRLGGLCFTRQGGTPLVRGQPMRKPRDTAYVRKTAAAMSAARVYWRDMGAANRATWNNAAAQYKGSNRVGLVAGSSGYLLWCCTAIRQLLGGPGLIFAAQNMGIYSYGVPVSVEVWPGGPMEVWIPSDLGDGRCYVIVRAQRSVRDRDGLAGKMLRVVGRSRFGNLSVNVWSARMSGATEIAPGLSGAFGAPVRGEWIRCEVDQYVPGYGPMMVSSHMVRVPSCGDELVVNGAFTVGGTPPTGWTAQAPGVLEQQVVDTYGDDYSGRWHVAAGGGFTQFYTRAGSRFVLVAGQSYTLRLAYKTVVGNLWRIMVNQDGIGLTVIETSPASTGGLWVRKTITFVSTYNCSAAGLYFQGLTNQATDVWIDNVSLRKDVY